MMMIVDVCNLWLRFYSKHPSLEAKPVEFLDKLLQKKVLKCVISVTP